MTGLPILVIFDIDETLGQFMNANHHHFLDEISLEDRIKIQKSGIEYLDLKAKNMKRKEFYSECFFFRPFLRDFLEFVKKNDRVHIAIWTYAERSYGEKIGEMITKHFGFSKNPFVFMYGAEDIEDDDYPKSLKQIWRDYPAYNKFNSFLVDDRFGNVSHTINRQNAIICQGFAPFGEVKTRMPLTPEHLEQSINDTMFMDLMKIINASFEYIDGCDKDECKDAFKSESIFNLKMIKKNHVDKYLVKINDIEMIGLGDVSNAASEHKGGYKKSGYKKSGYKKRHDKMTRKTKKHRLPKHKKTQKH